MLVLSRKVGERLLIGDNITILISRVSGNRVSVGIEAPKGVRVVRAELKPEPVTPKERAPADPSSSVSPPPAVS